MPQRRRAQAATSYWSKWILSDGTPSSVRFPTVAAIIGSGPATSTSTPMSAQLASGGTTVSTRPRYPAKSGSSETTPYTCAAADEGVHGRLLRPVEARLDHGGDRRGSRTGRDAEQPAGHRPGLDDEV